MVQRAPGGVTVRRAWGRAMLLACIIGAAAAAPGYAQLEGGAEGFTYAFDVRDAAGKDSGIGLGVDFDLRYERDRRTGNPWGNHYGFGARVRGFRAFDRTATDVNAVAAEVTLRGRYYRAGPAVLPAWQQTRMLEMAACDPAAAEPGQAPPCTLTPAEEEEYTRLVGRQFAHRRFFSYDIHYRFEATQDLTHGQHAFGAGLSGEIPVLGALLDAPLSVTRTDSLFRPREVGLYLGLDRVDPDAATPLFAGNASPFWRARWEMAWSTQVFNDLVLRATWEAQYLFDTPAAVAAADRRFNGFVQVWMIYPISAQTGVIVKYVDGRLPPDYNAATQGSVGFSITFQ